MDQINQLRPLVDCVRFRPEYRNRAPRGKEDRVGTLAFRLADLRNSHVAIFWEGRLTEEYVAIEFLELVA